MFRLFFPTSRAPQTVFRQSDKRGSEQGQFSQFIARDSCQEGLFPCGSMAPAFQSRDPDDQHTLGHILHDRHHHHNPSMRWLKHQHGSRVLTIPPHTWSEDRHQRRYRIASIWVVLLAAWLCVPARSWPRVRQAYPIFGGLLKPGLRDARAAQSPTERCETILISRYIDPSRSTACSVCFLRALRVPLYFHSTSDHPRAHKKRLKFQVGEKSLRNHSRGTGAVRDVEPPSSRQQKAAQPRTNTPGTEPLGGTEKSANGSSPYETSCFISRRRSSTWTSHTERDCCQG